MFRSSQLTSILTIAETPQQKIADFHKFHWSMSKLLRFTLSEPTLASSLTQLRKVFMRISIGETTMISYKTRHQQSAAYIFFCQPGPTRLLLQQAEWVAALTLRLSYRTRRSLWTLKLVSWFNSLGKPLWPKSTHTFWTKLFFETLHHHCRPTL